LKLCARYLSMNKPEISIVIPVYNEQEVLPILYARLIPVMEQLQRSYEVILVNDGSTDNTAEILREFYKKNPQHIRVINFNTNYGQHMAIMAGFEHVRGEIIVTLDADLQNPPEDIPQVIAAIDAGNDVVGGFRQYRKDKIWRKFFSKAHNILRKLIMPQIKMRDEGCMLRAYKRNIVDLMIQSGETRTFIPALALLYAENPIDVPVKHEERSAGQSHYSFYKLIRYNFDLVTNFSLVPIQLFTFIGIIISFLSTLLVIYMFVRRLVIGPEAQGVFTLFAIMFLLIGICLLGLGILGEYIGRIYQEVVKRPRFVIKNILEKEV
jgi:undecaprenyl-phosphate 4-deoxy-4-formamido-L-arabinose transferase